MRKGAMYADSGEGLKAVRDDFLYWTGKLTDSSLQLTFGLIAGNWAAFGSVQKILNNIWAKSSLAVVIASLALNLAGTRWIGELHRRRINYAAEDRGRWDRECSAALNKVDPWPFTRGIEQLGRLLREFKTWLPLIAGSLFLAALFKA